MILSKGIDGFTQKFEFVDSIVTSVKWDSNFLDLLIEVDYYWDKHVGREESRALTIRFKTCREAKFTMTKCYDMVSKDELKKYIYSWYTITQSSAKENNGLISISIKTVDDHPCWLTLLCEEIWIEGDE